MNKLLDISDMTVSKGGQALPNLDMCKCSECNTVFKVLETIGEYDHHDGWEMPAYLEFNCPDCEDGGCIDIFFYSEELKATLNKGGN
jgi:hypothetical protein